MKDNGVLRDWQEDSEQSDFSEFRLEAIFSITLLPGSK